MINLKAQEIGGGTVRRKFKMGEHDLTPGTTLTGDQIRTIPAANLTALINANFIDVWPNQATVDASNSRASAAAPADQGEDMQAYILPVEDGKFDVLFGRKLNAEPLKKAEARTLATTAQSRSTTSH